MLSVEQLREHGLRVTTGRVAVLEAIGALGGHPDAQSVARQVRDTRGSASTQAVYDALAALTGAAVGGLTSGIATWINHRSQVRTEWILHEKSRRQMLYRDFIEEAAKCYIDALQHDEADIAGLVGIYAKLSSMRALSSKTVVHCAEDVARKILDTYLEPDKGFVELREMVIDGTIDLLRGFSETCRDEFEDMRPIQF